MHLLVLLMAAAPLPVTPLLNPYDMLPAKIGEANLTQIVPSDMLYGSYQAPGQPMLDLIIAKKGVSKGPRCVRGKDGRAERLKIASHPACYSLVASQQKNQRIVEWNVRDFQVDLSLREGADFPAGRRLLEPAANSVAAWIDSLFSAKGPGAKVLQANREGTAYQISMMRETAERIAKAEPARRKSLELQNPGLWYVVH
jgi:hypothetical protein